MSLINGGVRLNDKGSTSWQAVWYMINVARAKISIISNDSLTGIIFRLDVPIEPENTLFKGIKKDRTVESVQLFNEDIYTIVFKFSILTHEIEDYNIGRVYKRTSTILDTLEETAIQQEIFCVTTIPSGYPITIAVVDFSYFDTKCASYLLKTLMSKHKDEITIKLLKDLEILIRNPAHKLGLISMELVDPNFNTMYKIEKVIRPDKAIIDTDYEHVIAQMVILVVTTGILHYDLHMDNAFGSVLPIKKDNNNRSYIIDFGRTKRITEGFIKSFKNNKKLELLFTILKRLSIIDFYPTENETQKIVLLENLENIIKFIESLDYRINERYYPQSKAFIKYLYPNYDPTSPTFTRTPENTEKYFRISKIIYDLTSTNKNTVFSNTNIQKYVKKEEIFSTPLLDDLSFHQKMEICKGLYFKNDLRLWDKNEGKGEKQRIKEIKKTYGNSLLKALNTFFTIEPIKHTTRSYRPPTIKITEQIETNKELSRQTEEVEIQKQKHKREKEERRREEEEQRREEEKIERRKQIEKEELERLKQIEKEELEIEEQLEKNLREYYAVRRDELGSPFFSLRGNDGGPTKSASQKRYHSKSRLKSRSKSLKKSFGKKFDSF
jgi:hypothetical protein